MALSHSPGIIRDGLALCLDAENIKSYPGSGVTWFDLSGNNYNFTLYGNPTYNSSGYFTFTNNQTTQYIMRYPFETPTLNITYSCWFRSNFSNATQTPFTYSVNGDNQMLFFTASSSTIQPWAINAPVNFSTSDMSNVWVNFTWTRIAATGTNTYYRDGEQIGTYTASAGTAIASGGYFIIGQESDAPGGGFDANQNLDGDFARLDIYNQALTPAEVKRNFNAMRSRYNL